MKIIEVARKQRDLLNEGMAFIAVWGVKQGNGKFSWYTEDFHPEDCRDFVQRKHIASSCRPNRK